MNLHDTLEQLNDIFGTLDAETKYSFETIDRRLRTLYDHKQLCKTLSTLILSYKETLDELAKERAKISTKLINQNGVVRIQQELNELRNEIRASISQLRDTLSEFCPLSQTTETPFISRFHDLEQLAKELPFSSHARNKVQAILSELTTKSNAALAKVKQALDKARFCHSQEHSVVDKEQRLLNDIEDAITQNQTLISLDRLSYELKSAHNMLDEYLRQEKNALDSIAPLFENKRHISRLVHPLLERFSWIRGHTRSTKEQTKAYLASQHITLEDVKRDLTALTTPDEVQQYIHELREHTDILEDKARAFIDQYQPLAPLTKRFLSKVGKRAATVSKKTSAELETFAQLDPRTRLLRPERFNEIFISRISRNDTKYAALLFIDIDRFKRFNETYGHQEGNTALAAVSAILRNSIRQQAGDIACRWGGEEMVVLLQAKEAVSKSTWFARAEELRVNIWRQTFPIMKSIHEQIQKNPGAFGFPQEIVQDADFKLLIDDSPAQNDPRIEIKATHLDEAIARLQKKHPAFFVKNGQNERLLYKNITVSIGCTVHPLDVADYYAECARKNVEPDPAEVLKLLEQLADTLLFEAKRQNRNNTQVLRKGVA